MRTSLKAALALASLSIAAVGCQSSKTCSQSFATPTAGANDNAGTAAAGGGDASRAIAEADIVALGSSWLYALSNSGSLAIVDVSTPSKLALLGSTTVPGQPFEMYERGNVALVMTNNAVDPKGQPIPPTPVEDAANATPSAAPDPNDGAALLAIDVRNPAAAKTLATFKVPGQIADSRIVGNILYLVTYENGTCFNCATGAQTVVTTFDVSDPAAVKKVDQATFTSGAPDSYNLAWGMAWKRSILATSERLYLGGQAYIENPYGPATGDQGIIDVVDISDPSGHLARGAHLTIAGAILNRWQMDEQNGVLRVISQPGAGFTGNGTAMPVVATFQVTSTQSIAPLGQTRLTLPMQEGLRTVKFDASRAYAITFNQTDPLFVIDLSDPAKPAQRGQLQMPGWMFYLEPFGDRVVGLGVDRTDPNGSLNVSLFDVSNMDSPQMLKRVAFGAKDLGEDYEILNYELPEDQDRIQKAFRVFADGTIAIPYSSTSGYASSGCSNPASGIQLVQWTQDTMTKRALLPVSGNPRRAIELSGQMLAVSDSTVASFSLADMSTASQTSTVTIGTCVQKTMPGYGGGAMPGDYVGGGYNYGSGGCY